MEERRLLALACQAREKAYAPYSEFLVGAALLASSGRVYLGVNVENASFGATNCAERTAFFKAVSEGERSFSAIAIAGGVRGVEQRGTCVPCGVCLQVMMEFCNPQEFRILLEGDEGEVVSYTLESLLPRGFGPGNLG